MHYYVNSPGKACQRSQSAMDSYLSTLGLWRKPIARDGYCLFRAASEQVYMTQAFYEKLYELSKEVFYSLDDVDEDYIWSESDAINALSCVVRRNFIIYEVPGCRPHIIDNGFTENVLLCRLDSSHLESVFSKSYVQKMALCQSIVYEILYKGVFGFNDEDIAEAKQVIREQEVKQKKKNRYSYVQYSCLEPSDSNSSSSGSAGEQSPEKSPSNKSEDSGVLIIKPPVPFRIAKALDPLIYRNTELDIWEEDKREARHRAIVYCPGDKCMIVSEEGKKLYHGHIQEVLENKSVIAFIEEVGERKEVEVDRLRPDKSSRSCQVFKHWHKRRIAPTMTVEQVVPPCMPKPPALPPSLPPPPLIQTNGEQQNIPVSNPKPAVSMPPPPIPHMAVPMQPPPVFHQPPMVTYGNGTEQQPPQQIPVACLGIDCQQPPFMPPPMMNGTMVQYNGENGMMVPESMMSSPVVCVPYMETISPTEVNVDYPPSEDSRGLDLPLNDINTLRFFFNLGVGHYRAVSLLSHSGMAQGQSGVVYCQSAPTDKYKTSQSNGVEYGPVFSTFIQPTTTSSDNVNENDDRSSNISNDSGCETNKHENEQENVKNSKINNVVCDRNESHSSDMSVSDTVNSPPPEVDTSSEQGYKTAKRRKYYTYKNLKLIKPIKEIPNKYLDLLKYLSLEKSRCEGEPIILAPIKVPQQVNAGGQIVNSQAQASQCNGCQVNLNPSAQTFVPGTNGVVFQNVQSGSSSNNQGTSTASSTHHSMPPPSSHTACSTSQNRLPNIPKHYVSPNNFPHYHAVSFQTGQ